MERLREKQKLLISFSGGRTSAYMTWWLLNKWPNRSLWEMIVVFANTGKEREETLEFVNECDKRFGFNTVWVEAITNLEYRKGITAKIVNFQTANRQGIPFEEMIKKHGIPNVKNPCCTRDLKKYAIRSYCRSINWKNYHTAIGIRIDEIDRISVSAKKEKFIYPLISYIPTRKNDINKFWNEQSFDLHLKTYEGNCDLCFKKSFRKLMTIINETPETIKWWQEMEFKYGMFIPDSRKHNKQIKLPVHFYRSNKSINDIIDMAKHPFEIAVDESQYIEYQKKKLKGIELDISNGCTEC